MFPEELRQIIPTPQPQIEQTFAAYQVTKDFYQEVQARADISSYCAWSYTTANSHRQELQQMRGELNIFAWFRQAK